MYMGQVGRQDEGQNPLCYSSCSGIQELVKVLIVLAKRLVGQEAGFGRNFIVGTGQVGMGIKVEHGPWPGEEPFLSQNGVDVLQCMLVGFHYYQVDGTRSTIGMPPFHGLSLVGGRVDKRV